VILHTNRIKDYYPKSKPPSPLNWAPLKKKTAILNTGGVVLVVTVFITAVLGSWVTVVAAAAKYLGWL